MGKLIDIVLGNKKWIYPELTPTQGLSWDSSSKLWISLGEDPFFNLVHDSNIRGLTEFNVEMELISGNIDPRIYWDFSDGFDEKHSFLFTDYADGKASFFISFPSPVKSLRFDPLEVGSAKFSIKYFKFRKVSKFSILAKLVKPYIYKAKKNPRLYFQFFKKIFELSWFEGFSPIRDAFNELISSRNGSLFRQFIEAKLALSRQRRSVFYESKKSVWSNICQKVLTKSALRRKSLHICIGLVEHFGDIVACEPVARYFRKKYPDAYISWVVKDNYRELIDSNPNIDETIPVNCLTDWIKWKSHASFDISVDLHVNHRICQVCRIPLNKVEGNIDITGENYFDYGSILKAFSKGAGLDIPDEAPQVYISSHIKDSVSKFGLPHEYVVFHTKSQHEEKDWNPKLWSKLATKVIEMGMNVIEIGLGSGLQVNSEKYHNLCGKTSLLQAAEVIRGARLFVGVESGNGHLANAVKTKSVILIGKLQRFRTYNPYSGDFGQEKNIFIARNENGPVSELGFTAVYDKVREALQDSHQKNELSNLDYFDAGIEKSKSKTRLIAFYLPQFHPIPENDNAWGKGFTEWTNVGKSQPFFEDQYQPRLPGDLGYYDLRVPEVMEQQAELATSYGIHGFCYYYYWFNGKRPLYKPIELMLNNPKVKMPFCFCWANENWTKRWDGMEKEVIIPQSHNHKDDLDFIRSLFDAFADPRYIRVDNKPLLIIYRTDLFPNPAFTAELWRNEVRKAGFDDLYLVRCESNDSYTTPNQIGYDASYEVPTFILPDELKLDNLESLKLKPEFNGRIFDYSKIVDFYCNREPVDYKRYPDPMLAWDNTPRHGNRATIFHNVTPELYERWLNYSYKDVEKRFSGEERLIFVNAWNEWAEGSYLEPDRKFGLSFLEATARASGQI